MTAHGRERQLERQLSSTPANSEFDPEQTA